MTNPANDVRTCLCSINSTLGIVFIIFTHDYVSLLRALSDPYCKLSNIGSDWSVIALILLANYWLMVRFGIIRPFLTQLNSFGKRIHF